MPIYEFYCPDCHMLFNFFSRAVNTDKRPLCPQCKQRSLERRMSTFAVSLKREENAMENEFPMDEKRMEQAMMSLAREAENIDENDPRQAAQLVKKMAHMAGVELSPNMEEAIHRMESGEDPENIEQDMEGLLDEEPFIMGDKKGGARRVARGEPRHDDTLYEL